MAMRYASVFLLFSLVIFSETSLLANERREVFYSVKKDLLGEYFDVAVYVEKSSVFPPSLHIINVYGESEAGRACVKEEYFILGMKENITHGETFHYCIGFVSEQSLQMGYMHQDEVYQDWHIPGKLVTAWIALTDVGGNNGGIEFISGSHKWKKLSIPVKKFFSGNNFKYSFF